MIPRALTDICAHPGTLADTYPLTHKHRYKETQAGTHILSDEPNARKTADAREDAHL